MDSFVFVGYLTLTVSLYESTVVGSGSPPWSLGNLGVGKSRGREESLTICLSWGTSMGVCWKVELQVV